ncbi:hypothetical protein AU468_01460 [Alkalispirochaeta sphaeroplastigenens]|uniref:Histone deacetylase domain-containing protein n=1 Tax=Alkalispirochaeta sphaeroplastigenens TaxID=1187066 RepID=A0A2S4K0U0_9SPIO|nr:histone deacetylase [Alkalispirochaeta sphaeroplastigenens]POR05375.1 hypothetical protein AU468_01460 [Alkalispirochaeta sphaeroplastigenens]
MILCGTDPVYPVSSFGIDVPITGSNAGRTLKALLAQDDLARSSDQWLRREPLLPLSREELALVHHADYLERLLADDERCDREMERTFELVHSDGSFHRYNPDRAERSLRDLRDQCLRAAGGTLQAARYAVAGPENFWFYCGGGMHHALASRGSGFCPVNDVVVALRVLQASGQIGSAWVVDVDAHRGDGTAALTEGDETIRTLSVHMARGWPLDQPRELPDGRRHPSWIPGDYDLALEEGDESSYVPRLAGALEEMEERFGLPDFILVLAGADPYERDQLPSAELLKLSAAQMLERDTLLYRWCRRRGRPALFVMAGNYGYHSWEVYTAFLERQVRGALDD